MKLLRFRASIFVFWLVIFYIAAHFWDRLNLANFTYFYTLVVVVLLLAAPQIRKIHLVGLLVTPVLTFVGLKWLFDLPMTGTALLSTLVEVSSIFITMLLFVWLRGSIQEFENAVADISIGKQNRVIESAAEGQSILYREVRRARNHQRPLSIMAISLDEKSLSTSLNQVVQDVQQRFIQQIALANVSQTLREKLEDCDIVVQTNDHFLVLLPETREEDLAGMADRLRSQVASQAGVDIKIGTATLPQDSFTLEGLVEKATLEMQGTQAPGLVIEPEQLFANNKAGGVD